MSNTRLPLITTSRVNHSGTTAPCIGPFAKSGLCWTECMYIDQDQTVRRVEISELNKRQS